MRSAGPPSPPELGHALVKATERQLPDHITPVEVVLPISRVRRERGDARTNGLFSNSVFASKGSSELDSRAPGGVSAPARTLVGSVYGRPEWWDPGDKAARSRASVGRISRSRGDHCGAVPATRLWLGHRLVSGGLRALATQWYRRRGLPEAQLAFPGVIASICFVTRPDQLLTGVGGRLAIVRYAQIATRSRGAAKGREGPNRDVATGGASPVYCVADAAGGASSRNC